MGKKLNIRQLEPRDKRVLMRVDFNVPLNKEKQITDDTRIRAALPSVQHLLSAGAAVVLMSHLGRPKGRPDPAFSLRPVADRLAELLSAPVRFANDTVGPDAQQQVERLASGEVLLLENLRFSPGETANDADFAAELAAFGEIYVNDAFGTAHRAHASTVGVTTHFAQCAGGFLMEQELTSLGKLLADPGRPFVAVLGGAKIKGKVDVIMNLLQKVDTLLLGGGMIFTFLRVHGMEVGESLIDEESLGVVKEINEHARSSRAQLLLPEDCVVSTEFSDRGDRKEVLVTDIPEGWQGLDIGSQTAKRYAQVLKAARSIFWNGPMGVFELQPFLAGTQAVAAAIAAASREGAYTVAGGGDTVAALNQLGLADAFDHVSTGGGASLEFMAGQELPGVAALSEG
jgi:phosphoglycerate kinase